MTGQDRQNLVRTVFAQLFGGEPSLWVQAPGRVDLMGSHTDYNQGYVLTMTVDRDTWIAARPRPDRTVAIATINLEERTEFGLDDIRPDPACRWADYVKGVAQALLAEGYALGGFEGVIHSTVPLSSGLSSSAALEAATAVLFREMGGWQIDPVRLALLCQKAENQFVGVNCGILDQYTSIHGQAGCALLLDCRHLTSRSAAIDPGIQVVICDTQFKRQLSGSEYAERRAQCETGAAILSEHYPQVRTLRDVSLEQLDAHADALPDVVLRRARFIIEENQRVLALAGALEAGDRAAIRALTAASFAGARDLYEISVPAMEAMMAAMLDGPGVIGARQAGAGFGGCMVAFIDRDYVDRFVPAVRAAYHRATGIEPHVYAVRASPGAGVLDCG